MGHLPLLLGQYKTTAKEATRLGAEQARFEFGYVLGEILREKRTKKIDLKQASNLLGLSPENLRQLIRGLDPVFQDEIKKWPKILENYYEDGWKAHQGDFIKYASALPKTPKSQKNEKPARNNKAIYASAKAAL